MNSLELTGRSNSHLVRHAALSFTAEKETGEAFAAMREEAFKEGIELAAVSSYRSFDDQMKIWNDKFSGKRTLYDLKGKELAFASLSREQLIHAILSWSALPGASRHHWGTDIDVIDQRAVPEGYHIQLIPQEYGTDGVFYPLSLWMEQHIQRFGFFKPYREYRGGVCAEPWHLSYAPVSQKLLKELSLEMIGEAIAESTLMGKEDVLEILPEIYTAYVLTICDDQVTPV